MGRRSWNNRSQPSETIGFWKIKCKCCDNHCYGWQKNPYAGQCYDDDS